MACSTSLALSDLPGPQPLTPTAPIISAPPDIPTYISQQIPLLRALHGRLALAPSALTDDLTRIDAAVRAAISSVVKGREDEVAAWDRRVHDGRYAVGVVGRAVGAVGRAIVARSESAVDEPLPSQYAKLVKQADELEKVYNERLATVQSLLATISQLAILLGPPFEDAPPPTIVGPAALPRSIPAHTRLSIAGGSATASATASSSTSTSTAPTAPGINKRHSHSAAQPGKEETVEWLDVDENVVAALEGHVERALAERDVRLRDVETSFNDLIWYRDELDLPPLPLSALAIASFPARLLPSTDTEETPGAYSRYLELLQHVINSNVVPSGDEEEAGEIRGMDGVEPEIGLMRWAEEVLELWISEKNARDERIQALYEKIEPLWSRLEVAQDVIDLFIESNRGSGEATIQAYEAELERVLEIRKTSLSSFVVGVRKEIAALQESLMMSDDEKGEFGAFINDEFTEELLSEHEAEAERLRAEVDARGPLLARVKEWLSLKEDEDELERSAADPNRFKKRGTAMLQEERMRKRVEKLKPRIEAELLEALPLWEEENGRTFTALGERVIQIIEDTLAAKEAAKEAKKRAKLGLAPPKSAAPPSTLRKRPPGSVAPTPATKRTRVVSGTVLGSALPTRTVPSTARRAVSGSSAAARAGHLWLPSPMINTPTPVYGLPRAFGRDATGAHANANAGHLGRIAEHGLGRAGALRPPAATVKIALDKGAGMLGVERGRTRRESFRPRQSIIGGMLRGQVGGVEGVLEEEDVF
ncbi:Microtubule bundling protein [Cryptotrichosporon argae]